MRRAFGFAVVLAVVAMPGARATNLLPVEASQVQFFGATEQTVFSYHLECAAETTFDDFAIGVSMVFPLGGTITLMTVHPRTSDTGSVMDVGDRRLTVSQERIETPPDPRTGFIQGATVSASDGPLRVFIAWAIWGGTAKCSLRVNGDLVDPSSTAGANAIYVAPEAFTGGLFYQDGTTQIALGRVFERKALGGPVLADLEPGGEGAIISDYATADYFPSYCQYDSCRFGVPTANDVLVSVAKADERHGEPVSELWMIALPPTALSFA